VEKQDSLISCVQACAHRERESVSNTLPLAEPLIVLPIRHSLDCESVGFQRRGDEAIGNCDMYNMTAMAVDVVDDKGPKGWIGMAFGPSVAGGCEQIALTGPQGEFEVER
jgi:hypothetical protein